jgi:hypothetical protein
MDADWPAPAAIDSGNGYHLYFALPATGPGNLAGLLAALSRRFSTPAAKLDTSVYNPSRIVRLPGTLNRKGKPSPDRPHRVCRVVRIPDGFGVEQVGHAGRAVDDLIRDLGGEPEPRPIAPPVDDPAASRRRRGKERTPAERAIDYIAKIPGGIKGQNGSKPTYEAAVAVAHLFAVDAETALGVLLEHYNPRCVPPWSEAELRHKINDALTKPHDKPRGWLLMEGV